MLHEQTPQHPYQPICDCVLVDLLGGGYAKRMQVIEPGLATALKHTLSGTVAYLVKGRVSIAEALFSTVNIIVHNQSRR